MNTKPTNPKDACGIKKAGLHAVPTKPLFELGLAMLEGARKYGAHNYRAIGTRASVYYDAACRHLMDWWEGEDTDPDSGIHHLMKAAACMFVMRDSILMGNYVDDRPIKYPDGLNLKELNKQAEAIIKKYSDCVNPFLQKDNSIKITAYLSHWICGSNGKNATQIQMQENCQKAINMAYTLNLIFPELEIYCPGEHDEFVQHAYFDKLLTIDQILNIDCKIIDKRDLVIFYTPKLTDSFSSGMQKELIEATEKCLPYIHISETEGLEDLRDLIKQIVIDKENKRI